MNWYQTAVICLTVCVGTTSTGCVRRRMTVVSNPPGATVYIDNQEVGVTPCSTTFTYYGTRQIRLVRDGYETLTVEQPILPPWYQIPPLDFMAENVWPREVRDERTLAYPLRPQIIVPQEQLMRRAEQLRLSAQLPSGQVPPTPPANSGPFAAPPLNPRPGGLTPQTLPPGGIAPQFVPE